MYVTLNSSKSNDMSHQNGTFLGTSISFWCGDQVGGELSLSDVGIRLVENPMLGHGRASSLIGAPFRLVCRFCPGQVVTSVRLLLCTDVAYGCHALLLLAAAHPATAQHFVLGGGATNSEVGSHRVNQGYQWWGKEITRILDWWLSTLEWLARMVSPCSSPLRLRCLSNLSGSLAVPPHRQLRVSFQGKLRLPTTLEQYLHGGTIVKPREVIGFDDLIAVQHSAQVSCCFKICVWICIGVPLVFGTFRGDFGDFIPPRRPMQITVPRSEWGDFNDWV